MTLGRTLLGSTSCIFYLLGEFDNGEVGDHFSWWVGKGDGIREAFLQEGLFIHISENRKGLDGLEAKKVLVCARTEDQSPAPLLTPYKVLHCPQPRPCLHPPFLLVPGTQDDDRDHAAPGGCR